jgi:preprotein translocase SecE subunit
MAEEEKKQPRHRKSAETVRERGEKHAAKNAKTNVTKKPSKLKGKIVRPFSTLKSGAGKIYKPIPVPDNKVGRVLGKKVHFIPPYFVNAWRELKLVTWPTPKEAARLTMAVVIFAIAFAILVQILDIIFSKLVKEILLK